MFEMQICGGNHKDLFLYMLPAELSFSFYCTSAAMAAILLAWLHALGVSPHTNMLILRNCIDAKLTNFQRLQK